MAIGCDLVDLGFMEYGRALGLQEALVDRRRALGIQETLVDRRQDRRIPRDVILLVEHPPVITFGRAGGKENLLLSPGQLRERGIALFETNRGGNVTYHGPGQVVGYPILDLIQHRQDLHWYVRGLEEALIDLLRSYGIDGVRIDGKTGVWVKGNKIAAIGVGVRKWVTMHGFALNLDPDLNHFRLINPCGLSNEQLTSMTRELGHSADPEEVKARLGGSLARVFGLDLRPVPSQQVLEQVSEVAGVG